MTGVLWKYNYIQEDLDINGTFRITDRNVSTMWNELARKVFGDEEGCSKCKPYWNYLRTIERSKETKERRSLWRETRGRDKEAERHVPPSLPDPSQDIFEDDLPEGWEDVVDATRQSTRHNACANLVKVVIVVLTCLALLLALVVVKLLFIHHALNNRTIYKAYS